MQLRSNLLPAAHSGVAKAVHGVEHHCRQLAACDALQATHSQFSSGQEARLPGSADPLGPVRVLKHELARIRSILKRDL